MTQTTLEEHMTTTIQLHITTMKMTETRATLGEHKTIAKQNYRSMKFNICCHYLEQMM